MLSLNEEKFINDVFLTLKKYIAESADADAIIKVKKPEALKEELPALSSHGISHDELLSEFKAVLENSVKTIHPLFLNQLFGGFDTAAWVGEVASTLLNPTMATFEIAPLLTVIEKRLVTELLKLVGLEKGEGIMVTGGSNANLLGMLCARTDYNPSIRQTGFSHNNFRVYI